MTISAARTHVSSSTIRRHRNLRTLAAAGDRDAHAAQEAIDRIELRYPSLATAKPPTLSDARNWRHATKLLIQHYTRHNQCFTAGEIARAIRIARPDLRFECRRLFAFVGKSVIEYVDSDGLRESAVEVDSATTGSTRSGSGSAFVVYAPSADMGLRHDGEVEIPRAAPLALGAGQ